MTASTRLTVTGVENGGSNPSVVTIFEALMSNRVSNSEIRRINILRRATSLLPGSDIPIGCLMNARWCFALTTEREVKQLITKGFFGFKTRKN